MTAKWFKNDWNTAGILLFITQFAWAMYLLSVVVYSIILLMGLIFGSSPTGFLDLPVRFRIQDISEVAANSETVNIINDAVLQTDASTFGIQPQSQWSSFLASVMLIGLNGIVLYGLTLLRKILRSLRREDPWDDENSKNLKIIGYLMLLAVPYKYGIGWLSYLTFKQVQLPESVSLLWPSVEWKLGLAGLAVILVAFIFKEGTRLYEEQLLTV